MTTVYCISIDPDPIAGGAVGGSDWFHDSRARDEALHDYLTDPDNVGTIFTTFDMTVLDAMSKEDVDKFVDECAWEYRYKALLRLKVVLAAVPENMP